MEFVAESKKNHVWRKVFWHTNPDEHPLSAAHSVEVYCCEEANGYAVWYTRKLKRNDGRGLPSIENGDYLMRYFSRLRRDEAIEWAVLIANNPAGVDAVIVGLDELVPAAQKV